MRTGFSPDSAARAAAALGNKPARPQSIAISIFLTAFIDIRFVTYHSPGRRRAADGHPAGHELGDSYSRRVPMPRQVGRGWRPLLPNGLAICSSATSVLVRCVFA